MKQTAPDGYWKPVYNCDVCRTKLATRFCFADCAVMCEGCDWKVHSANKLAAKHERVLLAKDTERLPCDICKDRPAVLFCTEDRALTCRRCDVMIHKANEFTATHHRFLLSGTTIGLPRLPPPGVNPPPAAEDGPAELPPAAAFGQQHAGPLGSSDGGRSSSPQRERSYQTRRATRSQAAAAEQQGKQGRGEAQQPLRGSGGSAVPGDEGATSSAALKKEDSTTNLLVQPPAAAPLGGLMPSSSGGLLSVPGGPSSRPLGDPAASGLPQGLPVPSPIEEHQLAMEKMKQDQARAREQALKGLPPSVSAGMPPTWPLSLSGDAPSTSRAGPSAPPSGEAVPQGAPSGSRSALGASSATFAHELLGLPAMSAGYSAKDVDAAWALENLEEFDADLSSLLVPSLDPGDPGGSLRGGASAAGPSRGMGAGPSGSAGASADAVVPDMAKRQRLE